MTQPAYMNALEAAYGPPSQAAFGSAVFYDRIPASADLEEAALAKYRTFVGELWERYGEAAWLSQWKEIYARQPDAAADIVAELRGITDRSARLAGALILDEIENAEQARTALASAFDDPAVLALAVYTIGDGAALSGLLIAGHRAETDEAVFLVFLLD
jgi:hypothetical protein